MSVLNFPRKASNLWNEGHLSASTEVRVLASASCRAFERVVVRRAFGARPEGATASSAAWQVRGLVLPTDHLPPARCPVSHLWVLWVCRYVMILPKSLTRGFD